MSSASARCSAAWGILSVASLHKPTKPSGAGRSGWPRLGCLDPGARPGPLDGRDITGEVEQPHLMQWATALRVPTSDGVGLVQGVPARARGSSPGGPWALPLGASPRPRPAGRGAADPERSWLLLDDAGERLRELGLVGPATFERWAKRAARAMPSFSGPSAPDADAFADAVNDRSARGRCCSTSSTRSSTTTTASRRTNSPVLRALRPEDSRR